MMHDEVLKGLKFALNTDLSCHLAGTAEIQLKVRAAEETEL